MSRMKDFFEKSLYAIKMGWAYVSVVPILILVKAWLQRRRGDGFYDITFVKVGRKWYCEVPGFPKELFRDTLHAGTLPQAHPHLSHTQELLNVSDIF